MTQNQISLDTCMCCCLWQM